MWLHSSVKNAKLCCGRLLTDGYKKSRGGKLHSPKNQANEYKLAWQKVNTYITLSLLTVWVLRHAFEHKITSDLQ